MMELFLHGKRFTWAFLCFLVSVPPSHAAVVFITSTAWSYYNTTWMSDKRTHCCPASSLPHPHPHLHHKRRAKEGGEHTTTTTPPPSLLSTAHSWLFAQEVQPNDTTASVLIHQGVSLDPLSKKCSNTRRRSQYITIISNDTATAPAPNKKELV